MWMLFLVSFAFGFSSSVSGALTMEAIKIAQEEEGYDGDG